MPRRWKGPLTLENVQTGDGRVLAAGSVEWADLPLPLGWIEGGDQHIDLVTEAPVVGSIDTITRDAGTGQIMGAGWFHDGVEEAGQVVQRLESGNAPLGSRWGVSIDPDNWQVQLIDMTEGDDGGSVVIMASSRPGQPLPTQAELWEVLRPILVAAAGEPDPGEGAGHLLFEDSVDSLLARYTRLRIRGATLCAVAAFDGAWIELDGAADTTEPAPAPDGEQPAATVTAAAAPTAPPAEWFRLAEPELGSQLYIEQPDGGLAVPLQITDEGQVFGHLARWGQCHTGYPGQCVTPPDSLRAYADFMVGEVVCADGERVATGCLTVGTDHAAAFMLAPEARDHYANTGLAWADVRVTSGELGAWVSGALRPGLDDEVVRVLRASALSGDWRSIGGHLELIAALSVNSPGFPTAREPVQLAAAAQPTLVLAASAAGAAEQRSLVAAGMVHRCADCAARAQAEHLLREAERGEGISTAALAQLTDLVLVLERRTRHLVPDAIAAAASALQR